MHRLDKDRFSTYKYTVTVNANNYLIEARPAVDKSTLVDRHAELRLVNDTEEQLLNSNGWNAKHVKDEKFSSKLYYSISVKKDSVKVKRIKAYSETAVMKEPLVMREEVLEPAPVVSDVADPSAAPEIFVIVEEMPEFPGGIAEMQKFVDKNLVYPEGAKKDGISGKCFMKFIVTDKGNIRDIQVLKGVPGCPECDNEAVRIVKMMPDWKPGKMGGKNVNVNYTTVINFKL